MNVLARSVTDLKVYQRSFEFQQEIFQLSKSWPGEERYALTDQIRRSSRSIGASLCEAWAKRRYPAHFVSKLTDADGELQETLHWIKSAAACNYLPDTAHSKLKESAGAIGKMLGSMIRDYNSFCSQS